jgi:hypothetical protein
MESYQGAGASCSKNMHLEEAQQWQGLQKRRSGCTCRDGSNLNNNHAVAYKRVDEENKLRDAVERNGDAMPVWLQVERKVSVGIDAIMPRVPQPTDVRINRSQTKAA